MSEEAVVMEKIQIDQYRSKDETEFVPRVLPRVRMLAPVPVGRVVGNSHLRYHGMQVQDFASARTRTKKVEVCSTCGATHHVTHGHAHDRQCRSCDPAGPIVVDVTASARVDFVLGCAVNSICETMQSQRCKIGLTRTRVRKERCSSVLLSSTSGMPVGGGR